MVFVKYSRNDEKERMFFMNAFDRIIGYSSIKKDLQQISDTLKNREAYDILGVSAPRGLLLYGKPGVGKSLMARAVIQDSGRRVFCCRKDSPNGDFVKKIKTTFENAVENAPSIVYLDDMDKFANGDELHPDAEEYVTVQSCIDETKDKQVFVLATANNMKSLPYSLRRAGRFDRTIEVNVPCGKDAEEIIAYYLKSKSCDESIDPAVIAKIMDRCSCAELETVINEAGLYAGYERAEFITMEHFLKACVRTMFHAFPDDEACFAYEQEYFSGALSDPENIVSQIAYHEAGHAVISEVLCPGSVTLISAYNADRKQGGFTNYYNDNRKTPLYWEKSRIISHLGGCAAIEQKFGLNDIGCSSDLDQAFNMTRILIVDIGICGLHLHSTDFNDSQRLLSAQEEMIAGEVEKYYRKAKEILSTNRIFFEKLAEALAEKKLLSAVDVQRIKSECQITAVPV